MSPRSSRLGPAAFALATGLTLLNAAGCVLLNPAYDGPSTSGGSGSDSDSDASATGGSMTIGDTVGGKCESDLCRYLDPPPIACYEFEDEDEDDSGVLTDERGCGRDGTLEGVTRVPGVYGDGALVNTTSSIFVKGGVWPELPNLTITAWIALPAGSESDAVLFAKAGHFEVSLKAPSDQNAFWKMKCAVVDNSLSVDYGDLAADGKWNMISCGCIAPPDDPGICSSVFSSVNSSVTLGSDSNLSKPLENGAILEIAPDFDGCIDSVQLWDRALTDANLTALYNRGKDEMPPVCEK